jgi:DNA-binding NtrC family response regulator
MKAKSRVIVIDDDPDSLVSVAAALRRDGYDVHPFTDPREGLSYLSSDGADVVVTDLKMPGLSGMEVIGRVVAEHPGVSVVVLTAFGTVYNAVEAMRAGASDFLEKPVGIPQLRAAVFKAVKDRERNREIEQLREEMGQRYGPEGIIAFSRTMEEVIRKIRLVAPTRMTRPHPGGKRDGKGARGPGHPRLEPPEQQAFLLLNCAAIPESLLESELFDTKGLYRRRRHRRKLEAAEGGTLFLDEVGDMALSLQAKLLRAIEQKEISRVGGPQVIRVDVRILAATNRDLKERVAEKAFREDLFYRLNVFSILVPPLRDRREDIPAADHFLRNRPENSGRRPPQPQGSPCLPAETCANWRDGNWRLVAKRRDRTGGRSAEIGGPSPRPSGLSAPSPKDLGESARRHRAA